MKVANRLSFLCLTMTLLVGAAAPAAAQRPLPHSRYGVRPAWEPSSGAVVSAEHRGPQDAAQPIFESQVPRSPRPAPGQISLARLQNDPPGKAVREMQKGLKAVADGSPEQAIQHYERAIEIHPAYIEAHNNLGVQSLKLGRVEAALRALEKAVELDPDSAEPHLNLSVALHQAGQLEAAAFQAERAIEIAPHSASANLSLGLVLSAQGRNLEEALRRLRLAAADHPGAALAAADVLLELGRPKEAHAALRAFLSRPRSAVN